MIRACTGSDEPEILAIVNEAARVYRGVIPADCWHEPYMSMADLRRDISAGVVFSGYDVNGSLVGIMGFQLVEDVALIRHAYVRPGSQRGGVGAALIRHLKEKTDRPLLVGTWADAAWAIAFYQRHGFELVPPEKTLALLRRYWSITDRQAATSVVLADRP